MHERPPRRSASAGAATPEFEALVGPWVAEMYRLAAAIVGIDGAEDVTQEALVDAWRGVARLRDQTKVRAWLQSIVVNRASKHLRARRSRPRLISVAVQDSHEGATADPVADVTRAVEVLIVDDQTGEVVASSSLAMGSAYQPGQVSVTASRRNPEFDESVYPMYRIEAMDGTALAEIDFRGGMGNNRGVSAWGPQPPVVLEPGRYRVRVMLLSTRESSLANPVIECSTEVAIAETSRFETNVDFGDNNRCWWSDVPEALSLPDYVRDKLLITFCGGWSIERVRQFEARFGLDLDHQNFPADFFDFRI